MATPVKMYGPPISTAMSRVLACLLEKEVPYQLIPVNMSKGEHKKPEYLKIEPFGQVPALQDEDINPLQSENMAQKAAGKKPFPVEDSSNPNFKPLPEPSCLDSFDNKSNLSLLLPN